MNFIDYGCGTVSILLYGINLTVGINWSEQQNMEEGLTWKENWFGFRKEKLISGDFQPC